MHKIFKLFLTAMSIAVVVFVLGFVVSIAINRQISYHCNTLLDQSQKVEGPFFLSEAESDMCDDAGLAINVTQTKEARAF